MADFSHVNEIKKMEATTENNIRVISSIIKIEPDAVSDNLKLLNVDQCLVPEKTEHCAIVGQIEDGATDEGDIYYDNIIKNEKIDQDNRDNIDTFRNEAQLNHFITEIVKPDPESTDKDLESTSRDEDCLGTLKQENIMKEDENQSNVKSIVKMNLASQIKNDNETMVVDGIVDNITSGSGNDSVYNQMKEDTSDTDEEEQEQHQFPENKELTSIMRKRMTKIVSKFKKARGPASQCLCYICKSFFVSKILLREHLQSEHGQEEVSPVLKCDVCKQVYHTQHQFQQHYRTHFIQQQLTCKVCSKTFSARSTFNRHKNVHKNQELKCKYCSKVFEIKKGLESHEKTHEGLEIFQCKTCEKSYASRSGLRDHENQHKGIKFSCSICDKQFVDRSTIYRHMRLHMDIAKYPCPTCEKEFKSARNRDEHMETHVPPEEKIKKFFCCICGKDYYYASGLRKHLKVHHPGEDLTECLKLKNQKPEIIEIKTAKAKDRHAVLLFKQSNNKTNFNKISSISIACQTNI